MTDYTWGGGDTSDPYDLGDANNWNPSAIPQGGDNVSITIQNTPGTALFGALTVNTLTISSLGCYFDDATIVANDIAGQAEFDQSTITAQTLENVGLGNNTVAT